jgi:hypothetical protein
MSARERRIIGQGYQCRHDIRVGQAMIEYEGAWFTLRAHHKQGALSRRHLEHRTVADFQKKAQAPSQEWISLKDDEDRHRVSFVTRLSAETLQARASPRHEPAPINFKVLGVLSPQASGETGGAGVSFRRNSFAWVM